MTTIPDDAKALLDRPEHVTVATIDPDGRPQLSVVWVKRDGDDVLFSTTRGRRKTTNLERDPRVSLLVFPHDNPYSYLEVRGTASLTDDPDASLIHELSGEYTGNPVYEGEPGEQRVIVRVSADHVVWHG